MNTTIEIQIAEIAAKQKDEKWAARQEAARKQQADSERQRIERHRANRIAQLQVQLKGIPARRNSFETHAADAAALCEILKNNVDELARNYAHRVHAEVHQGRGVRLELGSEGANAFFHSGTIKKGLRQLALIATARNPEAPLIDAEAHAAELRDEEKRLRAELDELQLK